MLLDDICTVLSGEDLLATYDVDLFQGSTAEIPRLAINSGVYLASGAVIGLIATGGAAPEYIQNNVITPAYLNPGFQVTVTADDADVADRVIDKVFYSLVKIRNRMINNNWYRWVKPLQSIAIDMGVDKRGQAKRVLNFIVNYNRRENL